MRDDPFPYISWDCPTTKPSFVHKRLIDYDFGKNIDCLLFKCFHRSLLEQDLHLCDDEGLMLIVENTCAFLFNHFLHGDLRQHIEGMLLTMCVKPYSNVQVVLVFWNTG